MTLSPAGSLPVRLDVARRGPAEVVHGMGEAQDLVGGRRRERGIGDEPRALLRVVEEVVRARG